MNIRSWTVPSLALVVTAALHCGGDDSTTATSTAGRGGSGGTISSGGSGGSLTTSGSGGVGGASGSGGSGVIQDGGTGGSGGITDGGGAGDAAMCPGTAPMPGTNCPGAQVCAYPSGLYCGCYRRQWRCLGGPDGGMDPDCPATSPTSGTSCGDAGNGTICYYSGMTGCVCNNEHQWVCR
jgi:hypothetical protein